ncbi:MAG TPA: hypothetical protein VM658_02705, partial [bacterium]|nr:hypothetical protein [bacterium]
MFRIKKTGNHPGDFEYPFEDSAVRNKRTGEPPRRQERQGLFLNTILRGLGCEYFLLGAPVGRFAKPVGANAAELFF